MVDRADTPDFTLLHRSWIDGLTLDDTLWFLSMVTARSQNIRLGNGLPYNDQTMWRILQLGYQDPSVEDRPWDASTRAMRYSAILGDRLQSEVEMGRGRVSLLIDSLAKEDLALTLFLNSPIAWRPRLMSMVSGFWSLRISGGYL